MKLGAWLDQQNIKQREFGEIVQLSQGRISQIVKEGTNDLATAMKIERATEEAVTLRDLMLQQSEATE